MNLKKWLIAGLLFAGSGYAAEFSSLEELMSGKDFDKAGLNKLTAEELDFLNQWLEQKKLLPQKAAAAPAPTQQPAAAADDEIGFNRKKSDKQIIESTIKGSFIGWTGKTRFVLANGQVWQQIGSGRYRYNAENPAIRIEPKALGSWKLYVVDTGRGIKVKRVK